jgi:hypothetical protein
VRRYDIIDILMVDRGVEACRGEEIQAGGADSYVQTAAFDGALASSVFRSISSTL